ncbi:glyoxalase [Gordonia sp. X0973]|uniref:VOC family protein n=1 Tax=Gordonia sp. X0973 TaxID=2742602 RepID=UPI000F53A3E9|nr:VOC family protein [Gordonia sp. X0973]QKT08521.1 glyoxalase [Gordonia sp. X0973]
MHDMIFVNLPVADLERSRTFFEALGYHFDDRFCDGNAAALVLGDHIVSMLMRAEFYSTFTDKTIVDAKTSSEVLINLSAGSREEVDSLVDRAVELGAKDGRTDDHGFMYGRDFEDLDGHAWGIMWMDPAAVEVGPEEFAQQGA